MAKKKKSTSKNLDKLPANIRAGIESDLEEIADLFRDKRHELGLSQEEVAAKLNIDPTTYQSIERKRRKPSIEIFLGLIKILKLKITLQ